MTAVGFIGIGTMGRDMALNLLAAGHRVRAYDVVEGAAESLRAHGAEVAASIAEATAGADLVVTMLPDTPQVEDVLLGAGGVRDNPPPGGVVIDMSTISPEATRRMHAALAAVGVALLDGPVSGGPIGAKNGTLSIMIGGEAAAFEKARPALEAMGKTIVRVGDSGAGQTAKLCNQVMVGLNLQAVCEALALGRAAGVDPVILREVMLGGSAASWMLDKLGTAMIAKDDQAGFRIDLMLKDLRLVGELAFSLGVPLPGTALVTSQYLDARGHGEGGKGNQALFRVYDRMTNQEP
ncbi:2-hydroxy-3-oxopropionate reductase [Stella humosa]|uniref:2-hydroxy-3-oxopropionate reductase n=1 Tax=Stella humosa TaxID=94 RepID=A0A3N1LHA4_9PROT|nr:NAD(P)-dependent oxidoreductase [Stella humosa]ROP90604.1 2-hydroxy-3-oxopropionate reductase [Stella humosa]